MQDTGFETNKQDGSCQRLISKGSFVQTMQKNDDRAVVVKRPTTGRFCIGGFMPPE